jgi:hypothetical protein
MRTIGYVTTWTGFTNEHKVRSSTISRGRARFEVNLKISRLFGVSRVGQTPQPRPLPAGEGSLNRLGAFPYLSNQTPKGEAGPIARRTMESDPELSGSDENRTHAPGEAESASKALPMTDNIEAKPSATYENVTIEPIDEPLAVRAEDFTNIDAKVKLLVKLALQNLDGD